MSSDIEDDIKNINVREARLEDAQLIADLSHASLADKVPSFSGDHHETAEMVLSDLRQGGGFILLVNATPSGSVRWLRMDDQHGCWKIRRMGTLPIYRGYDLSQHLLEAVIHHALTSDIDELQLGVRADQPRLLDFYAALGFEFAPELEYPCQHSPREALPIMMRRLFWR